MFQTKHGSIAESWQGHGGTPRQQNRLVVETSVLEAVCQMYAHGNHACGSYDFRASNKLRSTYCIYCDPINSLSTTFGQTLWTVPRLNDSGTSCLSKSSTRPTTWLPTNSRALSKWQHQALREMPSLVETPSSTNLFHSWSAGVLWDLFHYTLKRCRLSINKTEMAKELQDIVSGMWCF